MRRPLIVDARFLAQKRLALIFEFYDWFRQKLSVEFLHHMLIYSKTTYMFSCGRYESSP
jgi:hypothetical protein